MVTYNPAALAVFLTCPCALLGGHYPLQAMSFSNQTCSTAYEKKLDTLAQHPAECPAGTAMIGWRFSGSAYSNTACAGSEWDAASEAAARTKLEQAEKSGDQAATDTAKAELEAYYNYQMKAECTATQVNLVINGATTTSVLGCQATNAPSGSELAHTYLTQHNVECAAEQVLTSWALTSDGCPTEADDVTAQYKQTQTCTSVLGGVTDAGTHQTACESYYNNNGKQLQHFSKHYLKCPDMAALYAFRLLDMSSGGCASNQKRFEFKCRHLGNNSLWSQSCSEIYFGRLCEA